MGLRRMFKNLARDWTLRRGSVLQYRGLNVPIRRAGMNQDVLLALWYDLYEAPEIGGLSRAIQPGDRVLELGAGLGIVSALAGRATGPSGTVLSYEANPALLADTQAFLDANGVSNVKLVHAVLVNDPDLRPREFHLAGSFAESSLLGAEGRGSRGTVEVPADSLSRVLDEFQPDVLICDIEGAEVELFPTFPPSTLRAAVIELHPDRLTPAQIQSIHDGMAARGLNRQNPGPGGTVEIYARSP